MKAWKKALLVSLATATPAVALASTPGAGIVGTRHDFATRANFLGTQVPGTMDSPIVGSGATWVPGDANVVGQCSFCHTPHSAQSTLLLWNKTLSANTFTYDEVTTTAGTNYSSMGPAYKGPTVKCLACHDASVSIGDVSMYKGKARVGAATVNTFKVGDTPTSFTNTAGTVKTFTDADARPQYRVGVGGDLSGTHPVGMVYPLGQATGTYNSTTPGPDIVYTEFQSNPHNPTATAGVAGTATIKLYQDTGTTIKAGTAPGATGMECSTCHDPHNKQTTDDWLLRGKAQGSTQASGYICLQCHIK